MDRSRWCVHKGAGVALAAIWCGTFFSPATAEAAEFLQGVVKDSSGGVIRNARVTVEAQQGGRSSVRSGSDGSFRLDLPANNAFLVVEAEGFAAFRERISTENRKPLEVVLSVTGLPQQVAVVATGYLEDLDNSPRAATVLNGRALDQRLEYSIAESLREVPGVRVAQLGGPGSTVNIRIRGLRGPDTAVLVDGMRFRDPSAVQSDATGFTAELLTIDVSRLEVLRGCGSSLYGSNAMGGVVNIVSDSGGGKNRGDLLFEGGGLGFLRSQLRTAGGLRQDRFTYSVGIAHLNVLNGVDGDDRARNNGMHSYVQLRATDKLLLSARLLANNSYVGINASPALSARAPASPAIVRAIPLPVAEQNLRSQRMPFTLGEATVLPAANDPDSSRTSWLTSAMFAADQQLTGRSNLRLAYQLVDTRKAFPNGPGGIGFQPLLWEESTFLGRVDTVQARFQHVGGRNLFSAGGEYERESFDNGGTSRLAAGESRYRAQVMQQGWSAFAEDRFSLLGGRLQITASGRVQTFRLRSPQVSGELPAYLRAAVPAPPSALTGDVAVLYRVQKTNTKLRAHVGNAYRAPSLYERYGTGFFAGVFTPYGDPRLRPEQSIGGDFGVDQYLGARRVRLSATYFYTVLDTIVGFDFTGLINRTTDPFGRSSGYFNTAGGLARGVEMESEISPWRGMRVTGNYTHTRTLERRAVAVGTLRTPRIFTHSVAGTAAQSLGRLTVTGNYLWATGFLGVISGRAVAWEGPRRLDATAAYRLGKGERIRPELFTRVENLLGQQYYEDGFRTPGRYALGGFRVSY